MPVQFFWSLLIAEWVLLPNTDFVTHSNLAHKLYYTETVRMLWTRTWFLIQIEHPQALLYPVWGRISVPKSGSESVSGKVNKPQDSSINSTIIDMQLNFDGHEHRHGDVTCEQGLKHIGYEHRPYNRQIQQLAESCCQSEQYH